MAETSAAPACALVIETNNLQGGGGDRVVRSLARLLAHLRRQTRPLDTLDALVVTHEGALLEDERARLEEAAGRVVRFVELPAGTGYYEAKERGFDATGAAVVAFADADCWPDDAWLERLTAPFASDAVHVVAGRTTYRDDLLGIAATTIDFMYFQSPFGDDNRRNFYANNVAFRRPAFDGVRYGSAPVFYRGNCQVAGMKLVERGVAVRYEPRAHTVHRFPDTARELVKLRMHRGADTVSLTGALRAHLRAVDGPRGARALLRLGWASPLLVLGARFAFSVRALNRQGLPRVRGARRAACVGLIAGLSALDAVGAVRGGRVDRRDDALSYHGDRDRLGP